MEKIYLIAGASSDIGTAFVKALAAKEPSSRFCCQYRTKLDLELPNITPIQADLSDKKGVLSLIQQIHETPTHIVYLPAGRFQHTRLRDIKREAIENSLEIGLYSLLEIFKAFLPKMAKNKYGRVAVMLSKYVKNLPPKFLTDYVVSKYAMLGLVRSAAVEYEGKGIFINAVSPDMTQTKFLSAVDERIIENAANTSRFGRLLTPEEVAAGIEYLLSDAAVMSGENLSIG
jgi:3-oxoacyl-[acyl-carrier protein] reductase